MQLITPEYINNNLNLFKYLQKIGILPDNSDVRDKNVGASNYSKSIIQPWSVWQAWNLNPWDADIVKRVYRTKKQQGKTENDSRIEDYQKIIHICQERIRQLQNN